MAAIEHDDYQDRVTRVYAEQIQGMRDGLLAVNRNVLLYIAEGRERSKQLEAAREQLGVCAAELGHIKAWQRWFGLGAIGMFLVLALLAVGVVALLIKVF